MLSGLTKPIQFSAHARDQMRFRGASEQEVVDTIRTTTPMPGERGRLDCRKEFAFDQDWNGKRYTMKTVRPILAEEPDRVVVVMVYVYYR